MGASGYVRTATRDGIGTIRFHHPKKNSLPADLLAELARAVRALGEDRDVRVVVLRADGDGPFCAGASFDELLAVHDFASGKEFFMGFARLILALRSCPRFVIARVHGKTVGGGVGMAAAADYALATTGAAIKLSELALGIGPFVVGPAVERKIGAGPFAALAIDADWRDARWAAEHGLYARLHDTTSALDDAVDDLAARLAGFSPEAMTELKRVLWAGTDDWPQKLERRAEISGRLVLSDHTRRAIDAFRDR